MLNNYSNKLNQYTKYTGGRNRVHNDVYDQFRDGTSDCQRVKFRLVHLSERTRFDDVI